MDRETVRWAYRLYLDREPESEDVVQQFLSACATTRDLRRALMSSAEFRGSNPETLFFAPVSARVITEIAHGVRLFVDLSDTAIGANVVFGTYELSLIHISMKTYGLIVADNGSDLYVQGGYDTRWDNGVLNPAFGSLTASDFDVLELGWKPPVATSAPAAGLHTLPPCRVVDTRDAPGPRGGPALFPGSERVFALAGVCGVPADAKAVSVNLTVTQPQAGGVFRAFPGDGTPSEATALPFAAGRTRANNALLMLSSSGSGALAVRNDSAGTAHLLVDVNGYMK